MTGICLNNKNKTATNRQPRRLALPGLFFFFAAFISFAVFTPAGPRAETDNAVEPESPVIGEYNGGTVTLDEVIVYLNHPAEAIQRRLYRSSGTLSDWVKATIPYIVQERVLAQEARQAGTDKNPLYQCIIAERVSTYLRDLYYRQVYESIQISEDEIEAWYESRRGQYIQKEAAHARYLFLEAPKAFPELRRIKRKTAAEIIQKLESGESFAALCSKFSEAESSNLAGDIGWIERGTLREGFEKELFALKPGERSGVIEDDFGFNIIEMLDYRPQREIPLAEVSRNIERLLQRQQQQAAVQEQVQTLKQVYDYRFAFDDWINRNEEGTLASFSGGGYAVADLRLDLQARERNPFGGAMNVEETRQFAEAQADKRLVAHAARAAGLANSATVQLNIDLYEQLWLSTIYVDEQIQDVTVSEESVQQYYDEHRDTITGDARAVVHQVHIPFDAYEKPMANQYYHAREAAKSAREFLANNQRPPIDTATIELNKEVTLPYASRIDAAIRSLGAGQVSDIIHQNDGLTVLKIAKKFPPEPLPLEAVREPLTQNLVLAEKHKKRQEILDQTLENAGLRIYDDRIPQP